MALITCENVSIGYEGQTVVKELNFLLKGEITSALSERMDQVKAPLSKACSD